MHFVLGKDSNDCIPPNCTSIKLRDPSKLIFLCTFLQSNNTIKEVNLSSNQIEVEGAKEIAKALKVNRTVTKLNLSWNQIGEEGAEAIAKALKVNCTITKLDLSCNEIEDQGAKTIAEALKVNCTIAKLGLCGNKIKDEGAKALAEALKVNCTITKLLDLRYNLIGIEGAKAIAEALKVNCTLKELELYSNHIGEKGAKAITEALKVNCTITRLAISYNHIAVDEAFKNAKEINSSIMDELKPAIVDEKCKTMALGLFQKVPIYVLLDIHELVVISDLEHKINSQKIYNNPLFSKLFEKNVSKKRLVGMIDKISRAIGPKLDLK